MDFKKISQLLFGLTLSFLTEVFVYLPLFYLGKGISYFLVIVYYYILIEELGLLEVCYFLIDLS